MEASPQVQRIGRYEVVRKIATGGMAELFLARYLGPGGFEKRCALKRILPQFAADETFTRMFLTEAKVTAQLDHPNIAQIFELGQDDNGQYFIAMEMVNGVNLRQLLSMAKERREAVPPELAAHIVTQALEGLAYAHGLRSSTTGDRLNLVHRDISPQNLLVSYEGAVKLVDFGIVKGSSISGETQTGMLKGKVAYMSPEQAAGEPLDGRSDLFSLSVVLFELIAGERPFVGGNELMTLKAILESPPRPLTEFAPECPEGIEQAIHRGLAKYPQERYVDARSFHHDLDHVLRDCPVPLGRHVVADYVQSLTEGSTVSFDAQRLRIPRRAPPIGFAQQLSSATPFEPGNAPAAAAAANAVAAPPPVTPIDAVPPSTPAPTPLSADSGAFAGPGSVTPTPAASVERGSDPSFALTGERSSGGVRRASTMGGAELDGDALHAAGLGTRSWAPFAFLAVVALSWVFAWLWMRGNVDAIVVSPPDVPRVERLPDDGPPPAQEDLEAPPPLPIALPAPEPPTAPPPVAGPPAGSNEPKAAEVAVIPPRPPKPPPVQPTGELTLTSNPAGLTVRQGKRRLGRTPLTVRLRPGSHRLQVGSRRLGISKRLTVQIKADDTTNTRVAFRKGSMQVVSRPWAEVFIDGRSVGTTPLKVEAYEGLHEFRLVTSDGAERVRTVRVQAGDNPLVRVIF